MDTETLILNNHQVQQKITRIAHEIHEQNFKEKEVVFAGVDPTGYKIAELLKVKFTEITNIDTQLIRVSLDKKSPLQSEINIGEGLDCVVGKVVVLVDDVLNTGRTLAYALKPFLNIEVKKLQTAVLVDRDHRSFPVSADYVGYALSTTLQEHVKVSVDGEQIEVVLM